jgi:hypothetical protein
MATFAVKRILFSSTRPVYAHYDAEWEPVGQLFYAH